VDIQAVRAAYDAQIRRHSTADEPGAVIEADARVLRWVAPGRQISCITWSGLTPDSADAVIAEQKRYFAARGTPVEWKYYDYDQPPDLPERLVAAVTAATPPSPVTPCCPTACGCSRSPMPPGSRR